MTATAPPRSASSRSSSGRPSTSSSEVSSAENAHQHSPGHPSYSPSDMLRAASKKARKTRGGTSTTVAVNLSNCKYPLLRTVQSKLGWKEVHDDDPDAWNLYWTDTSITGDRLVRMKPGQKINHFVGMLEICRKRSLAKNLARLESVYPHDIDFSPKTYNLPAQLDEFLEEFKETDEVVTSSTKKSTRAPKKTFILKPDAGCQGKGICLVQDERHACKSLDSLGGGGEGVGRTKAPVVAQRYLDRPLLIDGYKFDLRVYALVLCADPLRIFLFDDGLARFCTERYEPPRSSNLKTSYMHLTNYAVNKKNENFVFNEDADADGTGSKWTIHGLRQWMEDSNLDFGKMWGEIKDLIVKTVISAQPALAYNYRQALPAEQNDGYACFEILGIDVMMDRDLKPWLIEVNHSPSFTADTPLDLAVKEDLISDTIDLVGIDAKALAKMEEKAKADAISRLFAGKWTGSRTASASSDDGKTREERLQQRREHLLREREKWEKDHSGSYEIVYPSPDPERQATYEQLLFTCKELWETKGQPHNLNQVMERAKKQAVRKATETEVRLLFKKTGRRQPTGDGWKKVIDAALENKSRMGRVGDVNALASVARAASGGDKGGWWSGFSYDKTLLDRMIDADLTQNVHGLTATSRRSSASSGDGRDDDESRFKTTSKIQTTTYERLMGKKTLDALAAAKEAKSQPVVDSVTPQQAAAAAAAAAQKAAALAAAKAKLGRRGVTGTIAKGRTPTVADVEKLMLKMDVAGEQAVGSVRTGFGAGPGLRTNRSLAKEKEKVREKGPSARRPPVPVKLEKVAVGTKSFNMAPNVDATRVQGSKGTQKRTSVSAGKPAPTDGLGLGVTGARPVSVSGGRFRV